MAFASVPTKSLCDIPVELQDVYELIDGTTEGDAELLSRAVLIGWLGPDSFPQIAWKPQSRPIIASRMRILFLRTPVATEFLLTTAMRTGFAMKT